MTVDGFEATHARPFMGMSESTMGAAFGLLGRLGRKLGVEVEGVERLPKGPVLIVANHTFGFDILFPMREVHHQTGRVVWSLGEHVWWKLPVIRRLAAALGTVDGVQENVDQLLGAGELVLVLPGGLRESLKPHSLRYRLLWGQRYGFVRAAVRNRVPMVPLAAIGADDIVHLVGNPFRRGRFLGRFGFPIPKPKHGLPILHAPPLRYVFGDPIPTASLDGCDDDQQAIVRLRHEIRGALQELIDIELARRASFDLGSPAHEDVRTTK